MWGKEFKLLKVRYGKIILGIGKTVTVTLTQLYGTALEGSPTWTRVNK